MRQISANPPCPHHGPFFARLVRQDTVGVYEKRKEMMELDLMNADTLVELVRAKRCSTCGTVASVEVHREPSRFAPVELLQPDHTEEVASHYQDSTFGNPERIRLEHKSG